MPKIGKYIPGWQSQEISCLKAPSPSHKSNPKGVVLETTFANAPKDGLKIMVLCDCTHGASSVEQKAAAEDEDQGEERLFEEELLVKNLQPLPLLGLGLAHRSAPRIYHLPPKARPPPHLLRTTRTSTHHMNWDLQ